MANDDSLAALRGRLAELEYKKAVFGLYLPTYFALELQDVQREIQAAEQQAQRPPAQQTALEQPDHSAVPTPQVLLCGEPDDLFVRSLKAALGLYGISVTLFNEQQLAQPDPQRRQLLARSSQAIIVHLSSATLHERACDLKELIPVVQPPQSGPMIIPLLQQDCSLRIFQDALDAIHADIHAMRYSTLPQTEVSPAIQILDHAQTIATAIIPRFLAELPANQMVTLDVFDFAVPTYDYPASLRLDWQPKNRVIMGTTLDWPELARIARTLQNLLTEHHRQHLAIRLANCTYSAALLIGYTFRRRTGMHLAVYEHNSKTWWTQATPGPAVTLLRPPVATHPQAQGVLIEVALSRSIDEAQINASPADLTRFQRLQLGLEGGPALTSIRDGDHAGAIVTALAAVIREVYPTAHSLHLLGAVPAALLVLLGAELHACTPIQWYEFDNNTSTYIPGCLIMDLR